MSRKTSFLLAVLLGVFIFITRFAYLSTIPDGLSIDEVDIGYNAYSILKTGKDEWGIKLPLLFKSIGDYKPPVLVYSVVPFLKLFGLTELAVRLPVALFSSATIIALFFLCRQYIFSSKYKEASWIVAFILSLLPWHVFYSRSSFEAIIGVFFVVINFYFWFSFLAKPTLLKIWFIFMDTILGAASYHSTKMFLPLIDLFFLITNIPLLKQFIGQTRTSKKTLLICSLIIQILILVWFTSIFVFGSGATRAKMTFVGLDYDFIKVLMSRVFVTPLFSINSIFLLINFWATRLFEYLSPQFYLFSGLNLVRSGEIGQGVLYLVDYFPLLCGLFVIARPFRAKYFRSKQVAFALIAWGLLGLLPATLANNSQHSLRTLIDAPLVAIIISLGLLIIFEPIKKHRVIFRTALLFIVAGYIYSTAWFADFYLLHYPNELSEFRQYGWKQVALFAISQKDNYDYIHVDPRFGTQGPYTYGVPQLYFLFYSHFDPALYNTDPLRQENKSNFENFIFEEIDWSKYSHPSHDLYVGSPWSFPVNEINSTQLKFQVLFKNKQSGLMAVTDEK